MLYEDQAVRRDRGGHRRILHKVGGRRLRPGRYLLVLRVRSGGKVIGVSDALPARVY